MNNKYSDNSHYKALNLSDSPTTDKHHASDMTDRVEWEGLATYNGLTQGPNSGRRSDDYITNPSNGYQYNYNANREGSYHNSTKVDILNTPSNMRDNLAKGVLDKNRTPSLHSIKTTLTITYL